MSRLDLIPKSEDPVEEMPRKFPPYGVGPAVWGPCFWTTMHIVSLGVSATPSAEEKEGIRKFYESLQVVIPCPHCRSHYKEALVARPIRLETRDDLVEWVYDIHNYINVQLGKPELPWDGFISVMRALPNTKESTGWSSLILGMGLGALGTFGIMGYLRRR